MYMTIRFISTQIRRYNEPQFESPVINVVVVVVVVVIVMVIR